MVSKDSHSIQLATLYQVAELISTLDLDSLLGKLVNLVSQLTQADSCLIYLLDHNSHQLILRASNPPHPRQHGKIKLKLGEGITGWVAQHQEIVSIPKQAFTDPRFKLFSNLPEDTYQAFLSVPILNSQGTVGVINAQYQQPHSWDKDHLHLLTAIGRFVGAPVETANLLQETQTLKQALQTQKLLNQAKQVLISQFKLTEHQAHKRIQKLSMTSGKSLNEICEAILLMPDMLA